MQDQEKGKKEISQESEKEINLKIIVPPFKGRHGYLEGGGDDRFKGFIPERGLEDRKARAGD